MARQALQQIEQIIAFVRRQNGDHLLMIGDERGAHDFELAQALLGDEQGSGALVAARRLREISPSSSRPLITLVKFGRLIISASASTPWRMPGLAWIAPSVVKAPRLSPAASKRR